jgi:hypothetical protein
VRVWEWLPPMKMQSKDRGREGVRGRGGRELPSRRFPTSHRLLLYLRNILSVYMLMGAVWADQLFFQVLGTVLCMLQGQAFIEGYINSLSLFFAVWFVSATHPSSCVLHFTGASLCHHTGSLQHL